MPTRRAVITGHVQGVGFRAYVRDLARTLGLRGEVWNRLDGAVEAEYEHEDADVIEAFESRLKGGPGRVDRVETSDLAGAVLGFGFEVGPTRR